MVMHGANSVGKRLGPRGHSAPKGVGKANVGYGFLDRGGNDLHDAPIPSLLHRRSGELNEGVGGVEMAFKRGFKVLNFVVQQRTSGWPAGVVDEDVNGAEGLDGRSES